MRRLIEVRTPSAFPLAVVPVGKSAVQQRGIGTFSLARP
ncbi:hypothetical protein HMPREF1249_1113 [Jonquetella sp. BV3C21]|nr:hypothetical protein HMPREF1249_1113 [Jonquetella sp. BV3C21]